MLKIDNITKTFGRTVALYNVSFEVTNGDFVFITGKSGSGKTTLLRLILREFSPDRGKIELDGKDIALYTNKQIPLLRQKIGTVFQDFKVLPERTVRENVEVALAIVGVPQPDWDNRVNRVLELTGIDKCAERFPSQLAGGELQRVALARALVVNPKIILADEPTGNLDWETADEIMDLFDRINKEGKTILMATHHQGIVERLNKKVIHLTPYEGAKKKEASEEKKTKKGKK